MKIQLNDIEARVLGSLIEKSLATPDLYPLTLASLTAACNQKSNRDPVMSLDEAQVRSALDSLIGQNLTRERSPSGSRVPKFSHRLDDSLGLTFGFDRRQLAVLCVLMLRGPQTPGELRTRTNRLCEFDDMAGVEATLASLAAAERGPYTMELPRQPGQRELRHMHLLGPATGPQSAPESARAWSPGAEQERHQPVISSSSQGPAPDTLAADGANPLAGRVAELEDRVDTLERALADLRTRLGED